mgnify:CR=1 FL=1
MTTEIDERLKRMNPEYISEEIQKEWEFPIEDREHVEFARAVEIAFYQWRDKNNRPEMYMDETKKLNEFIQKALHLYAQRWIKITELSNNAFILKGAQAERERVLGLMTDADKFFYIDDSTGYHAAKKSMQEIRERITRALGGKPPSDGKDG